MSAFKLSGKITGLDRLNKKLDLFKKEVLANQVTAMQDATFMLHSAAVNLIQDNADGRPEKRYNPKRVVNVSRPGEAPNTDTGRLVQSIKFDFKDGGLRGRVGTNLKYGAALEFGTSKMDARPWLSTAVLLVSKEVAKIFAAAFKKSTKEVSE